MENAPDYTPYSVGDRVVLIVDHPDDNEDLVIGCIGTVVGDGEENDWIPIRWDDEIFGGHTCDGRCEEYHGWNVSHSDVRPYEDREVDDEDIAGFSDLCSFIGVNG